MTTRRALVTAIVATLLLAGCSDGPKPKSTLTPTFPVTSTASIPTESATALATATPSPAGIDWTHRLAVYTTQLRLDQTPGRGFPVRAVVTWDLDAGRLAASFVYSGKDEYPIAVALAGRNVIVATEKQVWQSALDGTARRQLFATSSDVPVQDIAVSPDGRLLAFVASAQLQPGTLRILDLQTGSERLLLSQSDSRFAGMRGSFWKVHWRDDGQGVLVSTATYSEMYGSLATGFLDGRVRIEDVQGYGNISPTGRMRAGDVGEIGCMFIGSHQLVIRDVDSGTIVVSAKSPTTVYTPWEWSPDGKQFVFMQQEAASCEELSPEKQVAWVVQGDGHSFGAPTRVPDMEALHRQWYGEMLFSSGCIGLSRPVLDRYADTFVVCSKRPGETLDDSVRLGGRPAGTGLSPEFVGVIQP
jgi:WD40-like Beta Propeller Repeat